MSGSSDLRGYPKYAQVFDYLRRAHGPAAGRLAHASLLAPKPDGSALVFGGSMREKPEGTAAPRLALVSAEGGAPAPLASGAEIQTSPAWSPNGAALAFVADRRAIEIHPDAGPHRTLDPFSSSVVEEIAWNGDGARLLVRVAGSGADASGASGSGTVASDAQRGDSWLPHVESADEADAWRRAHAIDAKDGAVLWTSPDGDNVWEAVWCGPEAVVAVVSDDPSESSWYRARVVRYDLRDGKRREVYRSLEELGVPTAPPDGRYATILQACCSDRTVVAGDVLLFDLHDERANPRTVDTQGVDVTHVAWRGDGRFLYAGLQRLECVVGEYDVATATARELWRTSESIGADYPIAWPVGDGDGFVAVRDAYGRYQRIVEIENGVERVICDLGHDGSAFVEQTGGRAQNLQWTGRDGLEIDGILVLPGGDGPFPLVVNVHGGPVFSFRNDWQLHYYYVPIFAHFGYAVLNPNPRGSRGRGQEFARYVRGDMCGEDMHDILRGIDALVERGTVDPKRIAVVGRSYGGYAASWLVTQTTRFAAAVPMAPVTDNFSHHFTSNIPEFDRRFLGDSPYASNGTYAARSPVLFADRVVTPTLSMAGGRDRCTPAGQALEFHRALVENGVPSELVIYPEEGHHVERLEAQADQMTRILLWLERYMPA